MIRLVVLGLHREANTFAAARAHLAAHSAHGVWRGDALIAGYLASRAICRCFRETGRGQDDVETVALTEAMLNPGGVVTQEPYDQLAGDVMRLLADPDAPFDEVLLGLHAARLARQASPRSRRPTQRPRHRSTWSPLRPRARSPIARRISMSGSRGVTAVPTTANVLVGDTRLHDRSPPYNGCLATTQPASRASGRSGAWMVSSRAQEVKGEPLASGDASRSDSPSIEPESEGQR